MADTMPLRMAQNEIERDREALARDAQYLAEDARRFAAGIVQGGPYAGNASRLAQAALYLAVQGARIDALSQSIAYVRAATETED